jgi:hypothetical protein
MRELSDDERNLLRYRAESDRSIRGLEVGAGRTHQHLVRIGNIKERAVNHGTCWLWRLTLAGEPQCRPFAHSSVHRPTDALVSRRSARLVGLEMAGQNA